MSDIPIHAAGDCPGGCEKIKTVEQRLDSGSARMGSIESSIDALGGKLDDHIKLSSETNSLVSEVLGILHAGKGFFKIMGYIATCIKWTAAFVAPVLALVYTIKGGGKP